jgi:hypothetical protein
MGSVRNVAASTIITQILYELRDPHGTDYNHDGAYAELLGYINRCNELVYEILVDDNSELIQTGSGTLSTVAGTQSYALSSNSMGDFWLPKRIGYRGGKPVYAVWISEYDPMYMCEQNDIYDAIIANQGSTTSRAQPDEFCIIGDYLWFKDVPDAVYTVNLKYYPNFVPLTATTDYMPYKNLFNNDIIEGVKIFAKQRNELGVNVDATLKDLFMDRAMKLQRMRNPSRSFIRPRV